MFTNDRIVIPAKLRPEMLKLIHESHFGVEKCKSRARKLLYWPRISYDIECLIRECDVCTRFCNKHQREPLMSHDIPNARFYKIGVDIMTFKNIDYLVVVDYFSKFPKMCVLNDKTAKTIIEQLKCIFARYGRPNEVVSDNMPFQSIEFLQFSKDPYLSLLEYRNSPVAGLPYSPAQILMSKRLRSKIPCALNLLEPCIVNVTNSLNASQSRQQYYYNRGTKALPLLTEGEKVYCRQRNHTNSTIVVRKHANPRSYVVRNRHGLIRRNRKHLFRAPQTADFSNLNDCDRIDSNEGNDALHVSTTMPDNSTARTSCYGRRIVPPKKFNDYYID